MNVSNDQNNEGILNCGLEIFYIHSLSKEKRPEAILVYVIFDVAQRFSPVFCSRPKLLDLPESVSLG